MTVSLQHLMMSAGRGSVEADVFVVERCVVDADLGRCNPCGHLARLGDAPHQAADKAAVLGRRKPIALAPAPFLIGDRVPLGIGLNPRPNTDRAVEASARQPESEIISSLGEKP